MPKLEIVQHQMGFLLDKALHVFDKAILRIPPGQLDFRPTPQNMRARELAHHVYQVVHLLTRTAETGTFRVEALPGPPFDLEAVTRPEEIVAYGQRVKAYARAAVARFTEADMERAVAGGARPDVFETLTLAFEEALHHRGQLVLYLRLMGAEPPFLYDYR